MVRVIPRDLKGRLHHGLMHRGTLLARPRALCTGGLDPGDLATALFCISFLRKGEVLAYVWHIHNLKDLKDPGNLKTLAAGFSAAKKLSETPHSTLHIH